MSVICNMIEFLLEPFCSQGHAQGCCHFMFTVTVIVVSVLFITYCHSYSVCIFVLVNYY